MAYKRKLITIIAIVSFLFLYVFTIINVRFGYLQTFSNNPPLPLPLKLSAIVDSDERMVMFWLIFLIVSLVSLYRGWLRFSACFGTGLVVCLTCWIYYCVMWTTPMSANLLQKLDYFTKTYFVNDLAR